jgi:hypothetical protein
MTFGYDLPNVNIGGGEATGQRTPGSLMRPGGSFKKFQRTARHCRGLARSSSRRRRRRRLDSFASTCLDPALRAALGQRTVREDAELARESLEGSQRGPLQRGIFTRSFRRAEEEQSAAVKIFGKLSFRAMLS